MNSRKYRKIRFYLRKNGFKKLDLCLGRDYTRWERISLFPAREVVELAKYHRFGPKERCKDILWYFTIKQEGGLRQNWQVESSLRKLHMLIPNGKKTQNGDSAEKA